MQMAVRERKAEMRKTMEALRSAIPLPDRERKSQLICERAIQEAFAGVGDGGNGGTLFSYLPFGAEVDVTPLIEWCWRHGVGVAAPLAEPRTRTMRLYRIACFEDLRPGPWGIREPDPGCPLLLDLTEIRWVLMPGIAFDPQLGRLGYGGGYYDRFLERLAPQAAPLLLALAFDEQIVPEVPTEDHDLRVHRIITDKRMFP